MAFGREPYLVTLTVVDGAGQSDSDTALVEIVPNLPPRVVTVPWVSADVSVPHETYNGKEITLKGVVHDADPLTYQWDFGDGNTSGPLSVPADGHYKLEATHTYPDVPPDTPFTARLTVTDSQGNTGSDTYHVIVKNRSLNTEVNVAIDEGLWYLHKQQDRATGRWMLPTNVATTATAVNAFEANTHVPTGDPADDPYVETVRLGLNYMLDRLQAETISVQPAGDPDTNGNGLGIRVNENYYGYQSGMVMDALIASGAPLLAANRGPDNVYAGAISILCRIWRMAMPMVKVMSAVAAAGWRYSWNSGTSDNSVSQWGAIGLIPGERNFGIRVPDFVKKENLIWLGNSQNSETGIFGYTRIDDVFAAVALTPSGMIQQAMDEMWQTDPRWQLAENYMRGLWDTPVGLPFQQVNSLLNNYYAMFSLAKALRLAYPVPIAILCWEGCEDGPLDWYGDPEKGLARNLIDKQRSDGSWQQPAGILHGNSFKPDLASAWALLVLSKTLFEVGPKAEAGPDRVWAVDLPLEFDASGSFHPDPFRKIVRYEWDFDGDGIFDARGDSPLASFTYTSADHPLSILPKELTVTLRVVGNKGNADTDTALVTLTASAHPPVADTGGPYVCSVGLPCPLNGSGSYDIDPNDAISEYAWELDGVGVPDFDEAFGPAIAPAFPALGTFNIGLKVTDSGALNDLDNDGEVDPNERLSSQDFTTVTVVADLPPKADAGGPYATDEGSPVTLDGSGSSDPGNAPITYAWDLDDDGIFDDGTTAAPAVVFEDSGSFSVSLKVSNSVLSDTDTAVVTVANIPPGVEAGPDRTVLEDEQIEFEGAFTDPGAADTHNIDWKFGDNNSSSHTLAPVHTYQDPGVYTVTLTITDDNGGIGADTLTVTVQAKNRPPIADYGGPYSINEGTTLNLDATGSSDADGDSLTYAWDLNNDGTFGDAVGAAPTVSWTDLEALGINDDGSFTITLRVSDDDTFADATGSLTIDNVAPNAAAGGPYTIYEGEDLTLAGSGSDSNSTDKSALIYTWDLNDDGGFGDAAGATPTVAWADLEALGLNDGGNFTITLRVSDDDTFTDSTGSLTINNVAPSAVTGGPYTINEGEDLSLAGSGSDPSSADNAALVFAWDLNNDGAFDDAAGKTPTVVWTDLDALGINDDGTFTVTLRVSDDDTFADSTGTLTIQNTAPSPAAGGPYNINEGEALTLAGSGSDPSYADNLDLMFTWDLNNDGTFDDAAGAAPTVAWTDLNVLGINDEGTFTITLRLSDDDTFADSIGTLTIQNAAPSAAAGGPYTIDEGEALTLDGSGTDPSSADDATLTFSWDLNDDGTFGDVTGAAPTVDWADLEALGINDDGTFTITLRVSDNDTFTDSTSSMTIQNAAPTAAAGGPYTINEGQALTLAGSGTDPSSTDNAILTYNWDLNDDGTFGDATGAAPTVVWADLEALGVNDDDTFTITLRLSDYDTFTDATGSLTIQNAVPSATAGGPYTIDEGQALTLAGSGSDPSSADNSTLTFSWDLNDDGTFDDVTGAAPTVSWEDLEALGLNDDGDFPGTLRVSDDDTFTEAASTLTINNVAPVVEADEDQVVAEGSQISLGPATFTDAGSADTHTATIDWGDGIAPEAGVVDQTPGTVSGSHIYGDNGIYTVAVAVSDDNGGITVSTLKVTVTDLGPKASLTGDLALDEDQHGSYDASASMSSPDAIASYEWDWEYDGRSFSPSGDTGPIRNHAWTDSGTHIVAMRVTDDDGSTAIATLDVTVSRVQTILDLAARPKTGKVQLTWDPVEGAACYNIYRSLTGGGPYTMIAACHVADYSTYLDADVANGVTYYYVVTSERNGNESDYSNEASATPQARVRRRR